MDFQILREYILVNTPVPVRPLTFISATLQWSSDMALLVAYQGQQWYKFTHTITEMHTVYDWQASDSLILSKVHFVQWVIMWLCVLRPTVFKLHYSDAFIDPTKQFKLVVILCDTLTNLLSQSFFLFKCFYNTGNTDLYFVILPFFSHSNLFFLLRCKTIHPLK